MRGRAIAGMLLSLGLSACDSSRRDWEKARAADTTDAYVRFLEAHPDGTLAIDARRAIDRLDFDRATASGTLEGWKAFLTPARDPELAGRAATMVRNLKAAAALNDAKRRETVPAFRRIEQEHAGTPAAELARQSIADLRASRTSIVREVNRIAIVVKAPAAMAAVPIDKAAVEILALAGVEAGPSEDEADALLRIDVRASGLGVSYSRTGLPWEDSTYRVTGAIVAGHIELEVRQPSTKLSRSFSGRVPTAEAWSASPSDAVEAPPYFEAAGLDHTGDPQTTYHLRQGNVVDPAATMAVRLIELVRDLFGPSVTRAALTEPSRFRWAAVRATSAFDDPRIVDLLLELLPNAGADRDYVVAALGRSRDPRAVPLLLPMLAEGAFRRPAVEALGQIGDRRAALPLIEILAGLTSDDPLWYQREDVIRALTRIAGRSLGDDVGGWRQWTNNP